MIKLIKASDMFSGLIRRICLLVIVAINLCALSVSAKAAETPDVRMVIDVSGSMKRNDPKDLRQPAVDLLVRLLPQDSRAGVWTFGKYVNMLVAHREVDDAWRELAKDKAGEINSVGLFTNIGEALEKAAQDKGDEPQQYNKSIILLTDGVVDVSKDPQVNKKEWRRIVDEVIPKLKSAGVTVHTVALSENADKNLLEKIALATNGTVAVANSAEDLMSIFLKAFDVAAPAQQVPLQGDGFAIDSSVEEFTALIFRKVPEEQTQLRGPDGQVYDQHSSGTDVNWFRGDNYDLITAKQPLEGEWQIVANIAPESRITVVSDLKLKVKSLPSNLYRGEQLQLQFLLQEDNKTITNKIFLGLLDNKAVLGFGPKQAITKQLWQHDFSQFAAPQNGVYQTDLPQLRDIGNYELALVVDGKTFQRRFAHRISVREPFSAELKEQTTEDGETQQMLSVRSHSDDVAVDKTRIVATIVNPKNRKLILPLVLNEYELWQGVVHTDISGKYLIRIKVSGEDVRQEAFEFDLQPLELQYYPDAAFGEPHMSSSAALESSSVSAESSASATQSSVAETEELVSDDQTPQTTAPVPPWLLYTLLGVGNLILLAGGFFLFKKLLGGSKDEDMSQYDIEEQAEPAVAPETPAQSEAAAEPEAVAESDPSAMDDGDDEEEEPPMEDLDADTSALDEDQDAVAEAVAETMDDAVGDKAQPSPATDDLDDMDMSDDFGVDDIEEESSEQQEEPAAAESAQQAQEEALQAQGLDLADDELDDAISSLIDELDGGAETKNEAEAGDLDDFDFADDDETEQDDQDPNKPD